MEINGTSMLTMLNSLSMFQKMMKKSITRLSSGTGLVSAAGAPGDYALSRGYQSGIVAAKAYQGVLQSGLSMLQAVQLGLDSMSGVLNNVRSEMEKLKGPVDEFERLQITTTVDELLLSLNDIATSTQYNGHYLLSAASNPQGRTDMLLAFGPNMYQDLITATGVQDFSPSWAINNELQNIDRAFNAVDLGGTYQEPARTYDGGYLEAIQNVFTIGVDSQVPTATVAQALTVSNMIALQDDFTAGYLEPAAETFDLTEVQPVLVSKSANDVIRVQDDFVTESLSSTSESFSVLGVNPVVETFTIGAETGFVTLADTPKKINSVTVNGVEIVEDPVDGYTVSGQDIVFNGSAQPSTDDEVIVDYTTATTQAVFDLTYAANAGTETILLNGAAVDPADYTIDGTTLTFTNNIPVTGDDVDISYEFGVSNLFTLSDTPLPDRMDTMEVLVNGVAVIQGGTNGWIYSGNAVSFNGTSIPEYNDTVTISFDTPDFTDSLVLSPEPYQINQVKVAGSIIQNDPVNGWTLSGDTLTFNGGSKPYYGESIQIEYDAYKDRDTFQLAVEPYAGSLLVEVNGLAADPADYTLDGSTLQFLSNIPRTADQVAVTYDIPHYQSEFTLTDAPVAGLQVLVDGVAADPADFVVAGNILTFDSGAVPTPGAAVQINYQGGDYLDRMTLTDELVPDSMRVLVNGEELPQSIYDGWNLDGGDIVFNGPSKPFYSDLVELDYLTPAVPETYLLSDDPFLAEPVQVELNGVVVDPGGYTITGNQITFDGPLFPQAGDQVRVDYQAARSVTEFDLGYQPGEEPNEGTLQVLLNGVAVDPAEYQLDGTLLQLNGGVIPAYGDEVAVDWASGTMLAELDVFDVDNPVPNGGTLQILKNGLLLAEDAVDGWTFDGQKILLHGEGQGVLGDGYELQYQIGEDITQFTLDHTPNAESFQVLINGQQVIEDATHGWVLDGDTVTLSGLAIPGIGDDVTVNYQIGEELREVALSRADFNPDLVEVMINGQQVARDAVNGWSLGDGTVIFNGDSFPRYGDEIQVDFGVGPVMDHFEIERTPVPGSFQLTINGQEIQKDLDNGYTIEDRKVYLHGDATPWKDYVIQYSYDYRGGTGEGVVQPMVLRTGLGTTVETGLSRDLTLVGLQLEDIDLSTEEGLDKALYYVNNAQSTIRGIQSTTGTKEIRLEKSLAAQQETESSLTENMERLENLNVEQELVDYTRAQMMSNLIQALLAQANLSSQNSSSLLGSTMFSGSSFGF